MTAAQRRAAMVAVVLLGLLAVAAFLAAVWTRDQRWAETGTVIVIGAVVIGAAVWVIDQ